MTRPPSSSRPSVQMDSRLVSPGDVFVAVGCREITRHIREAINNGASIIVVPRDYNELDSDTFLRASDERLIASRLSAIFHCESPCSCSAVTGTNGKSSVVHFFAQFFYLNGIDCANLGTNGLFVNGIKEESFDTAGLTTPGCLDLHRILTFLKAERKIDYLAFEASSHALCQKRLHSVGLKVAAFTNLASDHMDYHGTKDEYFKAKQKLFSEIGAEVSVFSRDDMEVYNALMSLQHNSIITFGFSTNNDVHSFNMREFSDRVVFDLSIIGRVFKDVCVHVFGKFQVKNMLCGAAMAIASDASIESVIGAIPQIKQLNGRMEHVCSHRGGEVYVDYAHTAEAFRNCLLSFRGICRGRLIVVFGCGGDRDKNKRKLIGEIAGEVADISIITDDNPRTEDPASIRTEIAESCKNFVDIGARTEAIRYAMDSISNGDFVVIVGKGHETKQIYKDTITQHNDREVIISLAGIDDA